MFRLVVDNSVDDMEELSFESGEYYSKCYDTYKKKFGEVSQGRQIISDSFVPVVRKILQTNSSSSQFNVLSVGSGDGDTDFRVLKIVEAELQRDEKYQHMKIFNRAVEPNHHHINLYKKAIETLPNSLKNKTTFDIRQQTFEEYTQEESSREDSTKFHLIHFYHSMYYVDVDQTLKYCFEKELQENGKIMVVVAREDTLIVPVMNAANQSEHRRELKVEVFSNQGVYQALSSQIGWNYYTVLEECVLDVTEVFDEDSVEGNRLLDFVTQFANFRATADKAHLDKVLSVIRDQTVVKDGKRLGKNNDVFFIISK